MHHAAGVVILALEGQERVVAEMVAESLLVSSSCRGGHKAEQDNGAHPDL